MGNSTGRGAIQVVHWKNIAMVRMRRANCSSVSGSALGWAATFSMLRRLARELGRSKKYSRVKSVTASGSMRNSLGPLGLGVSLISKEPSSAKVMSRWLTFSVTRSASSPCGSPPYRQKLR